jgi:hypothetical protein
VLVSSDVPLVRGGVWARPRPPASAGGQRSSRGLRRPDYVPPYLAWVAQRKSGLDRDAWVKSDQLFSRPVDSLGPRLGRLAPDALSRVDASLRFVLSL